MIPWRHIKLILHTIETNLKEKAPFLKFVSGDL